ncbi:MAG: hypothetical protein KAQ92_03130 [Candidatus Aenigmarchaeota archaeon]|nr:hypothetical protein [Candidatus Aenigmarchaeota archaeon]
MTKRIILKTSIKREKGFLYFCGTDEEGNLTIGEVEMARGGKKKEEPEKHKSKFASIFGRKKK